MSGRHKTQTRASAHAKPSSSSTHTIYHTARAPHLADDTEAYDSRYSTRSTHTLSRTVRDAAAKANRTRTSTSKVAPYTDTARSSPRPTKRHVSGIVPHNYSHHRPPRLLDTVLNANDYRQQLHGGGTTTTSGTASAATTSATSSDSLSTRITNTALNEILTTLNSLAPNEQRLVHFALANKRWITGDITTNLSLKQRYNFWDIPVTEWIILLFYLIFPLACYVFSMALNRALYDMFSPDTLIDFWFALKLPPWHWQWKWVYSYAWPFTLFLYGLGIALVEFDRWGAQMTYTMATQQTAYLTGTTVAAASVTNDATAISSDSSVPQQSILYKTMSSSEDSTSDEDGSYASTSSTTTSTAAPTTSDLLTAVNANTSSVLATINSNSYTSTQASYAIAIMRSCLWMLIMIMTLVAMWGLNSLYAALGLYFTLGGVVFATLYEFFALRVYAGMCVLPFTIWVIMEAVFIGEITARNPALYSAWDYARADYYKQINDMLAQRFGNISYEEPLTHSTEDWTAQYVRELHARWKTRGYVRLMQRELEMADVAMQSASTSTANPTGFTGFFISSTYTNYPTSALQTNAYTPTQLLNSVNADVEMQPAFAAASIANPSAEQDATAANRPTPVILLPHQGPALHIA